MNELWIKFQDHIQFESTTYKMTLDNSFKLPWKRKLITDIVVVIKIK